MTRRTLLQSLAASVAALCGFSKTPVGACESEESDREFVRLLRRCQGFGVDSFVMNGDGYARLQQIADKNNQLLGLDVYEKASGICGEYRVLYFRGKRVYRTSEPFVTFE